MNPNDEEAAKALTAHMQSVSDFNLALVGDESVREKFKDFDQISKAGRNMFKAHASATAILVQEMEAKGFTRQEAVDIVSSMYPNLKFT